MAPEAAAATSLTEWSNHIWSSEAVRAAIVKSAETIKLVSTKDEVEVSVHKELLCFFSPYYTAALNGEFLEAQKDQLEVDLSGEQLQNFVNWIYTGKYTLDEYWVGHIYLYIFADQVDIIALRRDVLRWLSKSDDTMPDYLSVKLMLENVTQRSQLYRWMMDSYVTHWLPKADRVDSCVLVSDADPDHLLANFIYQVLKGVALRKQVNAPNCCCCNNPCHYHEHESKEEWKATCGQYEKSKLPASLS